jgi:hypothetical protein
LREKKAIEYVVGFLEINVSRETAVQGRGVVWKVEEK